MELERGVGEVVLPGDAVGHIAGAEEATALRLGAGLSQQRATVTATRAGLLRARRLVQRRIRPALSGL